MNRPYPLYRSSGVEWLGELPDHWKVHRLGFALAAVVGGGTPDTSNETYWAEEDEDGMPWVAISDMSAGGTVLTTEKRVTSLGLMTARLQPLSPETIIYSMYATVGAVARLGIRAVTNQAILGLLPGNSLSRSFLYWWLTGIRRSVLAVTRSNTQSNLNAETVGKLPLALPPLEEQRAISDFLEGETSRVDGLANRYRRLIERLAEYRTALITRAVTKGLPPSVAREAGLDPNPASRDSGVEWVGEVPSHWITTVVKNCYNIRLGKMLQPEPASRCDVETPYLKAQHVQWFKVNTRQPPTMWASENDMRTFGIRKGDLLVCEGGEGGRASLLVRVPPGFIIQNALHRVRAKPNSHNGFLQYWLAAFSATGWLAATNNKATIAHFTKEKFADLPFMMPPLNEQQAIAEFLDRELGRVDALVSRVEAALERLEEYRTALITAVVTGKIDVREHATERVSA